MGVYFRDNPQSENDLYKDIAKRQANWKRAQQSVNTEDAARASAIAKLYPNFSPDVITSMTMLKVKPESEILRDISRTITEYNAKTVKDKVLDPLKAATRFTFLGFEDLYRTLVDRPINSFIAATYGDKAEQLTFSEAYKQSGKSTVKQVFNQMSQGNKINLGDGVLPQSDVFDPQNPNSKFYDEYQTMIKGGIDPNQAQKYLQDYLGTPITEIDARMQEESGNFTISKTKDGYRGPSVPISLGRSLALQVAEPNTRTFDMVSGVIDAGKVLFLDPANYLSLGVKAMTKGGKTLKASPWVIDKLNQLPAEKLNDVQKAALGIHNKGWGLKFIEGERVRDYLSRDKGGGRLIEYMAKIDDPNKFIETFDVYDKEVVSAFMDITQDFTKTDEEKIVGVATLLDEMLGVRGVGLGDIKPTVGALGSIIGSATEKLVGGVDAGYGAMFGAKKVLRQKLMGSQDRASRIIGTYAKELPYRYLDSNQINDAVRNVKLFMDQTAIEPEAKKQIMNRAIRLRDGDTKELFNLTKDMVSVVADDLVENSGVKLEDADAFKKLFENSTEEMRAYFINQVTGNEALNPGAAKMDITVNGQTASVPDPHMLTQFINRTIPLPDPTQLAKAMNSMSIIRAKAQKAGFGDIFENLPKSMKQKSISKLIDSYYGDFWKPFVLLRGAWLLRVVGEEQIRMYARGYDNIFSRPLSILSLGLLKKTDAAEAKRWTQKNVVFDDILGNPLAEADEWNKASSRRNGVHNNDFLYGGGRRNERTRSRMRANKQNPQYYDTVNKVEAVADLARGGRKKYSQYTQGVVNEIAFMNNDRLFQFLFRGANTNAKRQARLEEFVAGDTERTQEIIGMFNKGGSTYKRMMSTPGGRYVYAQSYYARLQQFAGGRFTDDVDIMNDLASKTVIDEIDFTKTPFLFDTTPINQNIYNFLTTGKLKFLDSKYVDETIDDYLDSIVKGTKREYKNKRLYDDVNDILFKEDGNYFDTLPEFVAAGSPDYIENTGKLDYYVERAFDVLMGQRTDNASRSPVFRQAYWRAIYDLLPYMSPSMRKIMLDGGKYQSGNKSIEVAGALNANLPGQNLLASLKEDIGLNPNKLRKKETEINEDMFKRRIKELNDSDKKLGVKFEDVDERIEEVQTTYAARKNKLEADRVDIQENIAKIEEDYIINYGPDWSEKDLTDADLDRLKNLQDDEYLIGSKLDDAKAQFKEELDSLYERAGFNDKYGDAEAIDKIAKSVALSETQELLYDLSKRKKITYNLRALFPFGEAYTEIMSTWATLLKENPEILRRGQITVQALRDDNPFSPVEGEGFLGQDEVTGEEVFYYPMVDELVSDALFGQDRQVGVRLPGYASSLNLAMDVIPGIGPVVAIPASFAIEGRPQFDEVQKVLFPYGLPDVSEPGDLVRAAGAPAWLRNLYAAAFLINDDAPANELSRITANTTIDVYRVLKANGALDDTPQQQEDLLKEARSIAKSLTFIKAASQFVGPTGLNPRFDIGNEKNTGHVYSLQILADRYRELIDTPPIDEATGEFLYAPGDNYSATKYFIDEFGFNPLDIATPKSVVVEPRPVDELGVRFQKENPELFEKFPQTAFYLVPNGGGGPFDYEAYTNQIANEQRQPLTPEEWLAKRNQALGDFYMENARVQTLQQFDITDPYQNIIRSRTLSIKRDIARAKFPGFDATIPGLPQTATLDQQYQEIKKWSTDPKAKNTQVGKDVKNVLNYISNLEKVALNNGLSADGWRTSRTFFQQRQNLREYIGKLAAKNSDFFLIAERLLLPLFQERTDFLEDLEYDYDTLMEYGIYLPRDNEI